MGYDTSIHPAEVALGTNHENPSNVRNQKSLDCSWIFTLLTGSTSFSTLTEKTNRSILYSSIKQCVCFSFHFSVNIVVRTRSGCIGLLSDLRHTSLHIISKQCIEDSKRLAPRHAGKYVSELIGSTRKRKLH